MEVHHHPHPGHTWKEFAREIGIVVIGVLLALGADKIAEAIHWRDEVEQERAALLGEVRYNLATDKFRKSLQPCVDARLQQIGEVFRRHAKSEPLNIKGPVARPPFWGGSTGTWDIGVSGQALGHMDQSEKLAFSDAFQTYKEYNALHNEEDADWRKLALLDHADVLDANDWSRLHETWGDLIGMSNRLHSIGDDMLENMTMDQKPGPYGGDETDLHKAFCTPMI
jgi:hypothetical protein